MNVKYIFLINNKSGSRKGKEMKELLSNNEINTFDIYELSKTEKLQDELNKLINKERNKQNKKVYNVTFTEK